MRLPTLLTVAAVASTAVQAAPFNWGTDKIRGVGLGGWLLLEPFITPSIFQKVNDSKVIDEYTYGQKFGSAAASQRLQPHWDQFITAKSFDLIKAAGLNTVRIPIGYWAIPGIKNSSEPYPTGQYPYLLKAVNWAQQRNIKVIIDLHGAPGSQNGFDNSGRAGPIRWHKSDYDVRKTLAALKYLINDFVYKPDFRDTIIAVQPINEPGGFLGGAEGQRLLDVTKQYYRDSYNALRYNPQNGNAQTSAVLFLHDAFQDYTYWQGFMQPPAFQRVALDRHYYSIFSSDQAKLTNDQRLQLTCQLRSDLANSNKNLWTVMSEFGISDTDCAGSPNVVPGGGGAFYDGTLPGSTRVGSCVGKTGSASQFSPELKVFFRKYFEAQVAAGEAASGWMMWTWKTESAQEWSYYYGIQGGWLPKSNPLERLYPDPCARGKRDIQRLDAAH